MIVFRIISTVIMGFMCLISFLVSSAIVGGKHELRNLILYTITSWIILAFVIVSLWII